MSLRKARIDSSKVTLGEEWGERALSNERRVKQSGKRRTVKEGLEGVKEGQGINSQDTIPRAEKKKRVKKKESKIMSGKTSTPSNNDGVEWGRREKVGS